MNIDFPSLIPRAELPQLLRQEGLSVVGLLDAATLPGLPERVAGRGQESLCLFHGDKAEELRDVAPYLVGMTADSPLMRDFLNDGKMPWAMWPRRPGMLFVTDLSLPALQRHLRRFLRVTTPRGTFFFRFWEPASALAYFDAIAANPDRGRWFFPREGGRIAALLVPDTDAGGLRSFAAGADPGGRDWERRPFVIHPPELEALHSARISRDLHEMQTLMIATFPERTASIPAPELERAIRRSVSRCAEFGIRQRPNAFRIAAWDMHSEGPFEHVDPGGKLREILCAEIGESDKMRRLAERIAQLGPANNHSSSPAGRP
ncbi:MAG: DUF4123 domain-containing protein [Paracoccus sp. (in: a-proteobacteria)]|nr:DUF4123 domain-containing protein [Paracoccus sp. (in: a-proteobacteria)]